ncbi:MAG TPA: hypothetical protein ENF76_01975 [Candidatus Bathyarchaeota archaeon]|nr:hypothetical protein [Candidatus Bathyarchaeota archaeon]
MEKIRKLLLGTLFLLLFSMILTRAAGSPNGFPTPEQQTLMASLSPPNPNIGDDVLWTIWTDPNCSGQEVYLQITDVFNGTVIYEETTNLGTENQCGSLQKLVSTDGYEKHVYIFMASMTVGNMAMNCVQVLNFMGIQVYAYVTPYQAIPGEEVNLTVSEAFYPYVEAYANITVYNSTHPDLWTKTNVLLPEENGTCIVTIPTDGWKATGWMEPYMVNVTVISDLGESQTSTWFSLVDLIVDVEYFTYFVGDLVNITIRTYPTVSQAGLQISTLGFPPTIVVDELVALTNGKATRSYDSSAWTPNTYHVTANATIDSTPVFAYDSFSLDAFRVDVSCDKYEYIVGEDVNITVSTKPEQANAEYNITVTNSTGNTVWTHADHLDTNGEASVLMPTAGLPPGDYDVEVWVNNTQYVEWGFEWFELVEKTFNIEASVDPSTVSGYAMPRLTVTTDPGQTDANLSIMCYCYYGGGYMFNKTNFDCSSYEYLLPLPGMDNGTYYVEVVVTSDVGTNSTMVYVDYSHGLDSDGDGLSDSLEEDELGTLPGDPDSDNDGFFDGIEWFHGSDPLDGGSVIPELIVVPLITVSTISTFALSMLKLRGRKKSP